MCRWQEFYQTLYTHTNSICLCDTFVCVTLVCVILLLHGILYSLHVFLTMLEFCCKILPFVCPFPAVVLLLETMCFVYNFPQSITLTVINLFSHSVFKTLIT